MLMKKSYEAGADPGFSNRGGAKDYVHIHVVHVQSAKREVPYGQGPGLWKLQGFRCSLMQSEPYFEVF